MKPILYGAAALVAFLSPSATAAQSWTWLPQSSARVQAATAEWPSGVLMLVRCAPRRGLDMLLTLVHPVDAATVGVSFAFDGEEQEQQTWRLSEDGRTLFVRQPATFARDVMNAEGFSLIVTPETGPRQRYELETPDQEQRLGGILTACGHSTLPPPPGSLITNPDWLRRPNARHMGLFYPVQRGQGYVEGDATIECRVDARGRLEDCVVVSESPAGAGFGAATIGLAAHFQMRPRLVDGEPQPEALVRIPISWRRAR